MTIAEARGNIKGLLGKVPRDVLIVAIILLGASASFALGYMAGKDAGQGSALEVTKAPDVAGTADAQFVASKNGTRYYLPWCAGADRISEANKVWFKTQEEAKSAGYSPASNCDGL